MALLILDLHFKTVKKISKFKSTFLTCPSRVHFPHQFHTHIHPLTLTHTLHAPILRSPRPHSDRSTNNKSTSWKILSLYLVCTLESLRELHWTPSKSKLLSLGPRRHIWKSLPGESKVKEHCFKNWTLFLQNSLKKTNQSTWFFLLTLSSRFSPFIIYRAQLNSSILGVEKTGRDKKVPHHLSFFLLLFTYSINKYFLHIHYIG